MQSLNTNTSQVARQEQVQRIIKVDESTRMQVTERMANLLAGFSKRKHPKWPRVIPVCVGRKMKTGCNDVNVWMCVTLTLSTWMG